MADVAPCVKTFILFFLCGNPILKGAFVTLLNTIIARLSLEIDLLTLQIERLNIVNQITSLGISALNGLINQVKTDLNLLLGPLQQAADCSALARLNETVQDSAVGRNLTAVYKKLYDINRITNLIRVQDAIKQKKEEEIRRLQDMVDAIASLCP
jgi:hypothetical protein